MTQSQPNQYEDKEIEIVKTEAQISILNHLVKQDKFTNRDIYARKLIVVLTEKLENMK